MAQQSTADHRSKQEHKLFSVMGCIVQGHAIETDNRQQRMQNITQFMN
jgi:hypothetical protein